MIGRKILVISHDVVDTRMSGSGIRYWELARVLAREFPVTLAVPGSTRLSGDGFEMQVYAPEQPELLVRMAQEAGAVLAYGYAVRQWPFLADLTVPWIADVYVPEPTEALAWYPTDSSARRHDHYQNVYRTLEPLARNAGFFLCASERQRDFWLGILTAHGRLGPSIFAKDPTLRSLIDVVPFGLPSRSGHHTRPAIKGKWPGVGPQDPVILWGGGLWDWLDPLTLIQAMVQVVEQRPEVRLVFPGTRHPNVDQVPDMAMHQRAVDLARTLKLAGSHVFFGDWVDYDQWPNYLLEADVGVSLHGDTVESRFAFRTRVLDYIWASLPMVLSRGDILAERVAQDGLGYVVDCQDHEQVATALLSLLADPLARPQRQAAFSALRKELAWERVAEPLLRFCRRLEDRGGGVMDREGATVEARAGEGPARPGEAEDLKPSPPGVSDQRWRLAQQHEGEYWTSIKEQGYRGLTAAEFEAWHPIVQLWNLHYLGHSLDWYVDKTVVEIGCGPLGVVSGLRVGRRIGIDPLLPIYQDLWDLGSHNCEYLAAQAEQIPLPARTADVVICLNVLDHVQLPTQVLEEIRRILKDDGELFLSLDLEGQDEQCHPHGLDLARITGLLAAIGFQIDKAQTTSAMPDPERAVHFSGVCKPTSPVQRTGEGLLALDPAGADIYDIPDLRLREAQMALQEAEAQLTTLHDLVRRYEEGRFMRFMATFARLRQRLRAWINPDPAGE